MPGRLRAGDEQPAARRGSHERSCHCNGVAGRSARPEMERVVTGRCRVAFRHLDPNDDRRPRWL